jgi:hypothetical protein
MKFNLQLFSILTSTAIFAAFEPGKVSFSNPFGHIYNKECQKDVTNFNSWLYCIKKQFVNLTDDQVKRYFERDCNGVGTFVEGYVNVRTSQSKQPELRYKMDCIDNQLTARTTGAINFIKTYVSGYSAQNIKPIWRQNNGQIGNADLREVIR